jgi:ABC-2 type transport system ATP-binding protein
MLRRLSLAAAMVHEPELLFLDEPTAGVDPVLRKKFWDYFRKLQGEGTTLVITTQYVSEASYCDLVGVMAGGRLLLVETPEGLRKKAYGGEIVDLRLKAPIDLRMLRSMQTLPYVKSPVKEMEEGELRITVEEASTAVPALMEWCSQKGIAVQSIEQYVPPFDDVFYEVVKRQPVEGAG